MWEYEQFKVEADELDKVLTRYGQANFELISVCRIPPTGDTTYYRLFFKRRHEPGFR